MKANNDTDKRNVIDSNNAQQTQKPQKTEKKENTESAETTEKKQQTGQKHPIVSSNKVLLVVGGGLSAADTVVWALGQAGMHVVHVWRGPAIKTKFVKMFDGRDVQRGATYWQYNRLARLMQRETPGSKVESAGSYVHEVSEGQGQSNNAAVFASAYTPLPDSSLIHISPDGICAISTSTINQNHKTGEATTNFKADHVVILIGSQADLSFLPPTVQAAMLAQAQSLNPGSQQRTRLNGTPNPHPIYARVDPYSCQVHLTDGDSLTHGTYGPGSGIDGTVELPGSAGISVETPTNKDSNAHNDSQTRTQTDETKELQSKNLEVSLAKVPPLFAVGPLRGDNFVRFVVGDAYGVVRRLLQLHNRTAEIAESVSSLDQELALGLKQTSAQQLISTFNLV